MRARRSNVPRLTRKWRTGTLPVAVVVLLGCVLAWGNWGCGSSASAAAVAREIRGRVSDGSSSVQGERLLQPKTVDSFYVARKGQRAWPERSSQQAILAAIRGVAADGLNPADYHLEAIERLMEEKCAGDEAAACEADRDLLLTDAVAAMLDHLQYGRVRPVQLNPAWNVDPREDAPPLKELLARVAGSRSVEDALEEARPKHFIYKGLARALAELTRIQEEGGWPTVPAGKTLRPGVTHPRIAAVRRRLAVTGELGRAGGADSSRYDRDLEKAVKLFQQRHRLKDDGILDASTVEAMNVTVSQRIGQVRANLERARWVLPGLDADFLLVNLPAFKAYLIQGGQNVWETRTQIGEEGRQTPSFRAPMRTIIFNPDWTVPPTILEEDILEGMRRGENMIAKKQLVILDGEGNEVDPGSIDWGSATPENFRYTLRQPPGEDNALGRVKFLFPNRHSIYLHDTPSRSLFEAESRTFSSGCIRLERPLELAERLLAGQDGWTPARIQQVLAEGEMRSVQIEKTIPVLIVYWTVSVGASGEIRYMRDVYDLDPPLLATLDRSAARRSGVTSRR